jgi:plasmid stabilization system protein ParE
VEVFVTPKAEQNFDSVFNFIKNKWGEKTAKQFLIKTDSLFELLKKFPKIGKPENGDIRGFQLTRHTRLLYRIRGEKIIILAFFDVRQDPSKKSL